VVEQQQPATGAQDPAHLGLARRFHHPVQIGQRDQRHRTQLAQRVTLGQPDEHRLHHQQPQPHPLRHPQRQVTVGLHNAEPARGADAPCSPSPATQRRTGRMGAVDPGWPAATDLPGASAGGSAYTTPVWGAEDSGRRSVTGVSTETGSVRIGTRGSPMALAQARRVAAALTMPSELVAVTTHGDRWMGPLAAAGGKGAFVREIDRALLNGEIDVAVHCLKDLPGDVPVPDGLVIAAYLDREDVQDCVVTTDGRKLADLPGGATVGTSSVRRRAQLARHWPQVQLTPMRGNVNTRLAKLDRGEVDALILAVSGLRRIGQDDRIAEVLPTDTIIPPVGAGVIVLQVRADDEATRALAQPLNHTGTTLAATAERDMLWALRGHCHSPIAGQAVIDAGGQLTLRGAVYSPDGVTALEASRSGPAVEAAAIGEAVAADLLAQGARGLIDAIAH
jgi:hydroxymethylbilane synthase